VLLVVVYLLSPSFLKGDVLEAREKASGQLKFDSVRQMLLITHKVYRLLTGGKVFSKYSSFLGYKAGSRAVMSSTEAQSELPANESTIQ
jgi:hypothetical protein